MFLFKARGSLETRDCTLADDDALIAELTGVRYDITSAGKLKVEGKDEMKKRIGHRGSPDFADAFVLTFAGNAAIHAGFGASWQKPLMRNIPGIV